MSARRRLGAIVVGLLMAVSAGAPLMAQTDPEAAPSLVLTVDMNRLFNDSRLNEQLRVQVETRLADLTAENRRIELELAAEEQELTELRKTMTAEEFTVLADAFDAKVKAIRTEQDEKGRAVQQVQDEERANLLQSITPILAEIARERGAYVLVERRSVVLAIDAIDITDEAITRADAMLDN